MAITENKFIHHVYFWLNNPNSVEDKNSLIEGLNKVTKVETIKTFHIGRPADTDREVIDTSYAISWLLTFDTKEDEASYQNDPIHLEFVEEYKHFWKKVVVYDTVDL